MHRINELFNADLVVHLEPKVQLEPQYPQLAAPNRAPMASLASLP